MQRLVILTILLVSAISVSGCSNGPLKRMRRGSQCGTTSSCQTSEMNSSYYGTTDYGSSNCPTCGSMSPAVEYYEGGTMTAPPIGTIPAPGPGQ